MKILADQRIKLLFIQILLCITASVICSAMFVASQTDGKREAVYVSVCLLGAGAVILAVCYRYFREQNRIMEDAVMQIQEYIAGDRDARIECYEEGELYRLFHEVNSLAAILNAKAEEEGREKEFLRNTISDISHQLKTPIAALNIYNGIIQTEAEANDLETVREFSDLSDQELDRIETLVQNLLKITKFDAGTIVIEKRKENLAEMMEEVKNHFAFRAAQEGKEIVLSGGDPFSFLCDRNWIAEAVGNLVKNALDHMQRGNHVRIEWRRSAAAVRIEIKDDGSGIHPEDIHHIFKRFYRSRYSKDTQGIGLGLPLAKAVVETHNGTIEVDSRLGVGTTFVMCFLDEMAE